MTMTDLQNNIKDLSLLLQRFTGPLNSVADFLDSNGNAVAINKFYQDLSLEIQNLPSKTSRGNALQILTNVGLANILRNSVADVDGTSVHGPLADDVTINGSQVTGSINASQVHGTLASDVILAGSQIAGSINASQVHGTLASDVILAGSQIAGSINASQVHGTLASDVSIAGSQVTGSIDASVLTGTINPNVVVLGSQVTGSMPNTNIDASQVHGTLPSAVSIAGSQVTGSINASVLIGTINPSVVVLGSQVTGSMPNANIDASQVHGTLPSAVSIAGSQVTGSINASNIINLQNFITGSTLSADFTALPTRTVTMYQNTNCDSAGAVQSFTNIAIDHSNPIQNAFAFMQCKFSLMEGANLQTDIFALNVGEISMKVTEGTATTCYTICGDSCPLYQVTDLCHALSFSGNLGALSSLPHTTMT